MSKLNVIIVEKWVVLLGTARNHAKMLILLKKMSKTGDSPNRWISAIIIVYAKNVQ